MKGWARFRERVSRVALSETGAGMMVLVQLAVLLVLVAAVALGFRQSLAISDELDRQVGQRMVANYIERSAGNSLTQLKVQLTWDDAFNHAVLRPDAEWTDRYLGEFLWSNFHYNRLYLVDSDGRLVRGWKEGRATGDDGGYSQISAQVRRHLGRMSSNRVVYGNIARLRRLDDTLWPLDADGNALTRWSRELVRIDGTPAQLVIASIVPDTDMGLLRRTPKHLVSIRYFDSAFMEAMSRDLLLSELRTSNRALHVEGDNHLSLAGRDGKELGWFNWQAVGHGKVIASRMQPLLFGFMFFTMLLVFVGWMIVRMLLQSVAKLRESKFEAVFDAQHDAMTGLPNRACFIEKLELALLQNAEKDDMVIVVAFFDLDQFKYINDSLGHEAGDMLLNQVAQRCRARLAEGDVLARIGGDEFVLMRVARRQGDGIKCTGKELMNIFTAPFNISGRMIDITTSCGISWAPEQAATALDLLRQADIALFRAKQRGRARWRAFTQDMANEVTHRLEIESELRKALQNDALDLAYQPIVRVGDGVIEGAEALLRWSHPILGELGPSVFVPVAEQTGLMNQLGWWTIGRAFKNCKLWPSLNISVNLSPLQLRERGFLEDIETLVKQFRLETDRITFEVTEGILIEHGSHAFDALAGLKKLGFKIALDDFGTGYSSLSYLRNFQFDRIKIDRAFVQNIENNIDAQAIFKTIVMLGQQLNARMVAEGVETLLQKQLAIAAGCDLIQGFYYWRPMSKEQLSALLERQTANAPASVRPAPTVSQQRKRAPG